MTYSIRASVALAACLLALAGSPFAQGRTRVSIDPTTGRAEPPASTTRLPRLRASGGGRVIGFTTDEVGRHLTTLLELGEAGEDLIRDGHVPVRVDELSEEAFAGVDVLVVGLFLTGGFFQPTEAQLEAVENFVREGGNLVYLGENNPNWTDLNRQFAGRFGITFPEEDPPEVVLDDVRPHAITDGPFGVVEVVDGSRNNALFFGSMESPGPFGTSLVNFPDGFSAAVVLEPGAFAPGSGFVVAFAEITIFREDYLRGDNRILWRNLFAYDPPTTRFFVDFETQANLDTPLVNGQALGPGSLGTLASVAGFGPHTFGAAVYDSAPDGPNAGGSDPDLLVDLGNIVILQENGAQSVPGFYDDLDDAQLGGTLLFDFSEPVLLESIDLIDVCPGPPSQDMTLTLFDESFATRTYHVPGGWTGDRFQDGPPGFGTLELVTLAPQPGFAATATASETAGYDRNAVVRLEIALAGSGAIDNLLVDTEPDLAPLEIVACSLGCEATESGVFCSENDIAVNEEIRVTFNRPFDLATVDTNTFQVRDLDTDTPAPALLRVDPENPQVLIFKPMITFDSQGNPIFGLEAGTTYSFTIPGTSLNPLGPWIESRTGQPNSKQLACALFTTLGVRDEAPGFLLMNAYVDAVDENGELVEVFLPTELGVALDTDVSLRFNDVIDPSTAVNPVTGESPTITVLEDLDGVGGDPGEAIAGTFSIAIDLVEQETVVTFDPELQLRPDTRYVIQSSNAITDLVGTPLANGGGRVFVTEPGGSSGVSVDFRGRRQRPGASAETSTSSAAKRNVSRSAHSRMLSSRDDG